MNSAGICEPRELVPDHWYQTYCTTFCPHCQPIHLIIIIIFSLLYAHISDVIMCRHSRHSTWWAKKVTHKFLPMFRQILTDFQFFSPANSVENLKLSAYKIYHHTLTASLHYLAKCKFSKITTVAITTFVKPISWNDFLLPSIDEWRQRLQAVNCAEHWSAHWTPVIMPKGVTVSSCFLASRAQ